MFNSVIFVVDHVINARVRHLVMRLIDPCIRHVLCFTSGLLLNAGEAALISPEFSTIVSIFWTNQGSDPDLNFRSGPLGVRIRPAHQGHHP